MFIIFAKYCDLRVCVSVIACISQKPHSKFYENFMFMRVERSSSDDNATPYVFPVLWIAACFFYIIGHVTY